jgi:hypothetical protein
VNGGCEVKRLIEIDTDQKQLVVESNEGRNVIRDDDARIVGVVIMVQRELDL